MSHYPFKEVIHNEDELRAVIGRPGKVVLEKAIDVIDEYCQAYIAKSPFILIASSDAQGNADISPKGDPAGFVRVLNEKILLIPDRPGNRRADTLTNILQNPNIALFFLIPGRKETLRVNGTAQVVRDQDLLESFEVNGKIPLLMIAVTVKEAFFHCTKCVIRSNLWTDESVVSAQEQTFLAQAIIKHADLKETVETLQADLELDEVEGLY